MYVRMWCLESESNRYACFQATDFKSGVSTYFTTEALLVRPLGFEPRTAELLIKRWCDEWDSNPQWTFVTRL